MRYFAGLLLLASSFSVWAQGPKINRLVDMIPTAYSAETNQDSEPFLTVDPGNPNIMFASAFTPDPGGADSESAPFFLSLDGGATWSLHSTIPSQSQTADITHSMPGSGRLYAAILAVPADDFPLKELFTDNATGPTPLITKAARLGVDQPFVVARNISGQERIYIGLNDFRAPQRKTATLDLSLDAGQSFQSVRLEDRPNMGQDGPSIRPTVADDGTVYAAFFGWRQFQSSIAKADVVVLRDDSAGAGSTPFSSLKGNDQRRGVIVATVNIPWINDHALGPERIGSTLSIAADRKFSRNVYLAWGDRVGNGDTYTIHVRASKNGGTSWSKDIRTVVNATCVALAVADNHSVGFLYQQFVVKNGHSRWVTVLEQTKDDFASVNKTVLADVSAELEQPNLPYNGDYNSLVSVGDEFRGVFSANNDPGSSSFPPEFRYQRAVDITSKVLLDRAPAPSGQSHPVAASIDPIYFSVSVLQ